MAAGVPQVIFGHPSLLGDKSVLAKRPDLFWVNTVDELEALVERLFANPISLKSIPVEPPPYWDLQTLLKSALAP